MSNDQYSLSWKLYKAHSSLFTHDLDFYLDFCGNHKSLEIFSGYGRVTNYLHSRMANIYANELNSEFAKFIQIPEKKKFICDFFKMNTKESFERIKELVREELTN